MMDRIILFNKVNDKFISCGRSKKDDKCLIAIFKIGEKELINELSNINTITGIINFIYYIIYNKDDIGCLSISFDDYFIVSGSNKGNILTWKYNSNNNTYFSELFCTEPSILLLF